MDRTGEPAGREGHVLHEQLKKFQDRIVRNSVCTRSKIVPVQERINETDLARHYELVPGLERSVYITRAHMQSLGRS